MEKANNGNGNIQKRFARTIDELTRRKGSYGLSRFAERLERVKGGLEDTRIKPMSLFLDVVDVIRKSSADSEDYEAMLDKAEGIYDDLFMLGEDTPNFEMNAVVFKSLLGGDGLILREYFDLFLFYSFSDKNNYLTLMQVIAPMKNARQIFEQVRRYALEIRELLVDDRAYLTHLLKVTERLGRISPGDYSAVMEEELNRVRRSHGIYDVDPVRLAQVEKNVQKASMTLESGRTVLETLERRCQTLERLTNELDGRAQEICRAAEAFLETKATNAKSELEAAIKEYEDGQKQAAHLEKELFLKQVFADAESEVVKYQARAKAITATASADIASLSREADDLIRRVKNCAANDKALRSFAEGAREDEELLAKIERLSILNDSMIERLGREEVIQGAPFAEQIGKPIGKPGEGKPGPGGPEHGGAILPEPRGPRPPRQQRPIPAVNPLLDRSIPFRERFDIVMQEKQRRMAQGELFHEMFDDVITAVLEEVNPYLIGPSGCGKTYMIKQIGELLDLECTDIGYINEEYDILGYVTATGDYNESNFYRLYKYGGIAFCDELDNGNAKATVKLNSFLTNQEHAYYFFPGGERVEKHPNFRVVAAGNTDGSGADSNYNTRERIEESVQQRMIPIYVDYDNRVEKEILKDYPEWFEFSGYFRSATSRWSEVSGMPAPGIFTTRDAFRIRQYLDNTSFTPEKIMRYEFVQTKEPEYLGFLQEEMAKLMKADHVRNDIFRLFSDQVDTIRKRGNRT